MMKFEIKARVNGSYWILDYKCPPGWRGSGVYDKEVPCYFDVVAEVTAATEERAQELVCDYDYGKDKGNPWDIDIDSVDILDVAAAGESEDDEELVDITYGDCKNTHPEPEPPDPDEIYERRRDDRGTGDI